MLSDKTVELLNGQINLEFYSSNLYLQMSAWAAYKGLEGTATFLRDHAAEELGHMHRLFDYLLESDAMPEIGSIDAPPTDFGSVKEMFQQILQHEQHVTARINELVDAAFSQKDFSTFNFLQWYVAEQREEEHLFKSILDMLEMIGTEGQGLFLFDQQLTQMAARRQAGGSSAADEAAPAESA